jgi:hypothetical protein
MNQAEIFGGTTPPNPSGIQAGTGDATLGSATSVPAGGDAAAILAGHVAAASPQAGELPEGRSKPGAGDRGHGGMLSDIDNLLYFYE